MEGELVNTVYGPISAQFAEAALSDLCVEDGGVQTGPFGSQLHANDYVEDGTPIITVEHLGDNRIVHNNLPRVSDEDKERLARYTLTTGDIVFSRVGSVDRRAIVHPDENGWLFSGRCLRVRPDRHKIDPGYLSWFLGVPGFQEHIRQIAVGATMPSLNTKILGDVPVFYPPSLTDQRAIACILGALDDKIELNRKMNQTLEDMARAIFKSWFVDFDPVRAKAAGQPPPGLKPDIAALFPDRFEDSELGQIPKGWRVGTLGDVAEINAWTLGKRDELDFIDYIEISEVMRGEVHNISRYPRGKEPGRARRRLKHGDTVISTVRPDRGAFFLCIDPQPTLIASTGFAVLSPKHDHWAFLHTFTTQDDFSKDLGHLADGGAYPAVRPEIIATRPLIVPPDEVRDVFEQYGRPFLLSIHAQLMASRTLSSLRDALLPKLLSGELRVADAERIVGRCL